MTEQVTEADKAAYAQLLFRQKQEAGEEEEEEVEDDGEITCPRFPATRAPLPPCAIARPVSCAGCLWLACVRGAWVRARCVCLCYFAPGFGRGSGRKVDSASTGGGLGAGGCGTLRAAGSRCGCETRG